jgi:hypothetical protein
LIEEVQKTKFAMVPDLIETAVGSTITPDLTCPAELQTKSNKKW